MPSRVSEGSRAMPLTASPGTPGHLLAAERPNETGFELSKAHRNVKLSFALAAVSGVADTIWYSGVALPAFLFALGDQARWGDNDDNALVGFAEGASGLAQLLFALPIGYMADRFSRSGVIKVGGVASLAGIAATVYAVVVAKDVTDESNFHEARVSYGLLVFALVLWGIVEGVSMGPTQALLADYTPKEQRPQMYTHIFATYILGGIVGPIVSIILFSTLGESYEDWTLEQIAPVMIVGVVLEAPIVVLMFAFRDDPNATQQQDLLAQPLLRDDADDDVDDNDDENGEETQYDRRIPIYLSLSSLIVSLGSGCSVKFFPLFFKDIGLSVVAVQGLYVAVPVCIALASFASTSLAKTYGRIRTTLGFSFTGIALLFVVCVMEWTSPRGTPDDDKGYVFTSVEKVFVLGLYLLRTSLMNATYPLLESTLMDAVPQDERARWKSLESVAVFGWAGSAVLGGYLADEFGYGSSFVLTCALQALGSCLLLPLLSRVDDVAAAAAAVAPVDESAS